MFDKLVESNRRNKIAAFCDVSVRNPCVLDGSSDFVFSRRSDKFYFYRGPNSHSNESFVHESECKIMSLGHNVDYEQGFCGNRWVCTVLSQFLILKNFGNDNTCFKFASNCNDRKMIDVNSFRIVFFIVFKFHKKRQSEEMIVKC